MEKKEKEQVYDVSEIVFLYKLNDNTGNYLKKKYGDKKFSIRSWENNFKKDCLNFSKP